MSCHFLTWMGFMARRVISELPSFVGNLPFLSLHLHGLWELADSLFLLFIFFLRAFRGDHFAFYMHVSYCKVDGCKNAAHLNTYFSELVGINLSQYQIPHK